ncbi:MAG: hypothetical protein FWC10_00420 [Lentimicrobiaceae bacterium]|nr:hypothetical protein [Lentimicrobiaceae bacterium]
MITEETTWYDVFIELLHEKYPKNAQLTYEIMNLLCLEREAAYRRLRKDVAFTANEIAKIVTSWNISLDEIIGVHSGKTPFRMQAFNYLNPSPKEFGYLQKRVNALDHFQTDAYSEYMEVGNRFPRPINIGFLTLYRFLIFYWAYQYSNNESLREFSKVTISKDLCKEFERYKNNLIHVKNTSFILDEMIFEAFVHSVDYYHSISAITDKEKELIKEELYGLLEYLSEIANKGCYPETGNKVNIYISQLTIDTNYSYYYSDKLKSCRIHAFGKFDITTYDSDMVANFRTWMNLKKRSVIQISEVNEKRRIEYFAKQRKIVDSL